MIKFLHRFKCCHWYPCLIDSDCPFPKNSNIFLKFSWSLFVLYVQIFFDISVLLNCTQALLGVIVLNYSEQGTVHELRIIATEPAFGKVPIRKYATLPTESTFKEYTPWTQLTDRIFPFVVTWLRCHITYFALTYKGSQGLFREAWETTGFVVYRQQIIFVY